MANYSSLIATINASIRQNGTGAITGQLLQSVLGAMVGSLGAGFQYMGVATPATNPGSPDENVFYFAPAGNYPYFGNSTIPAGKVGILKWAVGNSWVAEVLPGVATNDLVEELGGKILNNSLTGSGQTYVSKRLYGLIPGRSYRVLIKDTNWDITGITGNSNYKFLVRNDYNGGYTILVGVRLPNSVKPYYDITIPANSDYITIGGRAAAGAEIEFNIQDITDTILASYDTGLPKLYTKDDAISKIISPDGIYYGYIFPLNDEAYLYAVSPEGYKLTACIYNDYLSAERRDTPVRYCGDGYYINGNDATPSQYRVGTTGALNGFLVVWAAKVELSTLTSADISTIDSNSIIEINPKSTIAQIRENTNKSKLSNGLSVGLDGLWPYVCNNNGRVSDSQRVKFFDFNFIGNNEVSFSVDVSAISIQGLQYGIGIWRTVNGAQGNLSGDRLELYSTAWQTGSVYDWVPTNPGVLNLYFRKSDNSAFSDGEVALIRENLKVNMSRVKKAEVQGINYFLYSVNHRGYNTIAPENTLPAFILSRKKGFNYVETDVAFTADDVPVLLHDSTINRTARNMDGTQLSVATYIYNITYSQALQYDFGIWKGAEWAGTPIPTFAQFIQLCKELSLHPFIELKDSITWTQERCERIADEIKAVGMEKNVSFISFSNTALSFMASLFPEATLGLATHAANYDSSSIGQLLSDAAALRTQTNKVIVSLDYTKMTGPLYDQVTAAGFNSLVWTVNSEDDAKNLSNNTVGVLSDDINAGALIMDDLLSTLPAGV